MFHKMKESSKVCAYVDPPTSSFKSLPYTQRFQNTPPICHWRRWPITLTILCLRIRLYILTYKAHTRFTDFHDDAIPSLQIKPYIRSATRNMARWPPHLPLAKTMDGNKVKTSHPSVQLWKIVAGFETRRSFDCTSLSKADFLQYSCQVMTYTLTYLHIWRMMMRVRTSQCGQVAIVLLAQLVKFLQV